MEEEEEDEEDTLAAISTAEMCLLAPLLQDCQLLAPQRINSTPGLAFNSLLPNQMIFVIAHWVLVSIYIFHNPDDREI